MIPGSNYAAANSTVLWRGDICRLACDAILNAANSGLCGYVRIFQLNIAVTQNCSFFSCKYFI